VLELSKYFSGSVVVVLHFILVVTRTVVISFPLWANAIKRQADGNQKDHRTCLDMSRG